MIAHAPAVEREPWNFRAVRPAIPTCCGKAGRRSEKKTAPETGAVFGRKPGAERFEADEATPLRPMKGSV